MFTLKRSIPLFIGQVLAVAALAATSLSASSQTVPLSQEMHAYAYFSPTGLKATEAGVVNSHEVRVEGADWLRLQLAEVKLPKGAQLVITSLQDGAQQHLTAKTAKQWQNTTAYFNGSAVRVDLLAGRAGEAGHFGIVKVVAGKAQESTESQCGPTDDRVASNVADRARLLNIGCTVNLMAKTGCFITAGHCLDSNTLVNVVEFNVPKSNANGSLNHPAPKDQYAPDTATRKFTNGGIGNDWGVFNAFPNTETGLTPLQAQGSKLKLATAVPAVGDKVKVYGYGVDSGVDNQTQQLGKGPVASTTGTTLRYAADTEGGNSGSAVISGGRVVAIHTHAGCTVNGGANQGTLFTHTGFQAAVAALCKKP